MPRTTSRYGTLHQHDAIWKRDLLFFAQRGGLAFSINQSYLFCETSLAASETVFHSLAGEPAKAYCKLSWESVPIPYHDLSLETDLRIRGLVVVVRRLLIEC